MIKKILLILLGLIILVVAASVYAFYPHKGPTTLELRGGGYEITVPNGYSAVQNRLGRGNIYMLHDEGNNININLLLVEDTTFDTEERLEQLNISRDITRELFQESELYIDGEESIINDDVNYFAILAPNIEGGAINNEAPNPATNSDLPYMLQGDMIIDGRQYMFGVTLSKQEYTDEASKILKSIRAIE